MISSMGMFIGLQLEGAKLQPEQAAGPKTDNTAQQGAPGYVYRVMDAHVYLRVCHQKSPGEYQSPPAAELPEGEEHESSQGEMVAGMGGGEAGTYRAIIHEDPYVIGPSRVLAGAKPEDQVFHPMAADQVADNGCHNERYRPPAAFFPKIQRDKYQEK